MAAVNPDEIISILKEEIKNYDEISKDQEVGTVISVGDGIYLREQSNICPQTK